jgi:diaminopimelate decarboxylase
MDWTLFPDSARIDSCGGLSIGGQSLRVLAETYGTPLYLYDGQTVRAQVARLYNLLRQHYPGEADLTYAAKAYFAPRLAKKLAGMDLGVDVVSLGEMQIARKAGFAPERIHLHGNNKSPEEIALALQLGIQSIVVDSLDELRLVEKMAQSSGQRARIWLRITPGIAVHTHPHIQTAHEQSKFGLYLDSGEALAAIRVALSNPWLELVGLHTHLGSQIHEVEPYTRAIEILMKLAEEAGFIPQEISPGGGWGVRYVSEDPEDDAQPWVEAVSRSLEATCRQHGWPLPRLVLEPGRWLVARAGVAVYRIGTRKKTPDGLALVAVDGGMADNPRVVLYGARYTACLVNRPEEAKGLQPTRIVGRYCESGDVLIHEALLPPVESGELLAIPVAGAYHLSMASNYNLSGRPAVLWVEDGKVEVLQPREEVVHTPWWQE